MWLYALKFTDHQVKGSLKVIYAPEKALVIQVGEFAMNRISPRLRDLFRRRAVLGFLSIRVEVQNFWPVDQDGVTLTQQLCHNLAANLVKEVANGFLGLTISVVKHSKGEV